MSNRRPREARFNLQRIFVCNDIWLNIFPLLAPEKVGLALALVSHRFDKLVDTHLKSRKWTIGHMRTERAKNGAKIGLYNSDWTLRELPIPQGPLPDKIVAFKRISLRYIDHSVIAFLHRIRRLFHLNIVLVLNFSSIEGRSCAVFANFVWPLLNGSTIVKMHFKVNNNCSYLRTHISPSILRDCANLWSVSVGYGIFPQFPPDDSDGASVGQALCKWLHTPRTDGRPKVLICFLGRAFPLEELKAIFLNATTSVSFIIVVKWYCHVVPFELENGLTGERLALSFIQRDWSFLERAPIERNMQQWAEWKCEAFIDTEQRKNGLNELAFRAYDDDIE